MIPHLFYYIFVFLVFASICFDVFKSGGKRLYRRTYNITYFFLALLVAFRYGTGNDTPGYMYAFSLMPDLTHLSIQDFLIYRAMPGYVVLVATVKQVFGEFVYLQILQAFLFFHSFYKLLSRLNLRRFYLLLAFYGYVYFAELSGVRECFGLAFIFYGLQYFIDRRYIRYYLFVLLAILMHAGMFIFLALPLIRLFRSLSGKNFLLLLVGSAIVLLSLNTIRSFLGLLDYGSIGRYAGSEGEGISVVSMIANAIQLVIIYVFAIKKNKKETYPDFIYLGVIGIVVSIAGGLIPILYRYTAHFTIFYFYCMHAAISHIKKGQEVYLIALLCLFYYSPLTRFLSSMSSSDRLQYCSVFASDSSKAFFNKEIQSATTEDLYRID